MLPCLQNTQASTNQWWIYSSHTFVKDLLLGELNWWLDQGHNKVCGRTGRRRGLCWYFNVITRNLQFYVWSSCSRHFIIPELMCSKWARWQSHSNRYTPVEFAREPVCARMCAYMGGGCGKSCIKGEVKGKCKFYMLKIFSALPREDWTEWLQRNFNIALSQQEP